MNINMSRVIRKPYEKEGASRAAPVIKNPLAHARDTDSTPVSGRSPGGGNGNPLQGNPMERGAWQATVHGAAEESDTT